MRHLLKTISLLALTTASPALAQTDAGRTVTWNAGYTGEGAAVVDGGLDRTGAYAGQLMLGADVDLNRLANWQGAKLHIAFVNRHGDNLSNDGIGNSTSVQEIYGAQNTRLTLFSLEQSLFDGRLVLEGGRTVANIGFLGSPLCQYFQTNSACGNPTFVFKTSNFTWWPASSWGANAKVWVTPNVYAHVGVYEVNPERSRDSDHGFDWDTKGSTGVDVPFALGYRTTAETDAYPRMYEVGGWFDEADYADPLRDVNGVPAVTSGQPYAVHNGRSGVFARFEQTVWKPELDSQRSLIVFGAALATTSGDTVESNFQQLGLVMKGPFEARPKDSLGFVVTRQGYSDEALENLRLARASAGGTGTPHDAQVMMELSYGFQVTPQVRIQPNVQYVINPDQLNAPTRTEDLPNAFVVGLRFDIDLAGALGLNR